MQTSSSSSSLMYDTRVLLPGTALLELACNLVDKYEQSWLKKYNEADLINDDVAMGDTVDYLYDCQHAQLYINPERYNAGLDEDSPSRVPPLNVSDRIKNLLHIDMAYSKASYCIKDAIAYHKKNPTTPEANNGCFQDDDSSEAMLLSLLSILVERKTPSRLMLFEEIL